jgi:VanZ family protein
MAQFHYDKMTPNRRNNRLKTWALALLVVYWLALILGTHVPQAPHVLLPKDVSDKLLHLTAYCGLALLICLNWSLRRPLNWRHGVIVLALLACFGALDEVTQIPVGRDCDLADWYADVIGATAGVGLFLLAAGVFRLPEQGSGPA